MKLFGANTESDRQEPQRPDESDMPKLGSAPVGEEERLVLDIEGVEKVEEPETSLSMTAETRELPDPEALLKDTLEANIREMREQKPEAPDPAPAPEEAAEKPAPEEAAEKPAQPEPPAQTAPAKPEGETPPKPEPPAQTAPAKPEGETPPKPEPLASVSYASVAEAVESAKKDPTGRFARDAVDDETLLSELYALIGESPKPKAAQKPAAGEKPVSKPVARPLARITAQDLQQEVEEEALYEIPEENASGTPGWLKGAFILLISLMLSAMTFYAVASDLLGKIF